MLCISNTSSMKDDIDTKLGDLSPRRNERVFLLCPHLTKYIQNNTFDDDFIFNSFGSCIGQTSCNATSNIVNKLPK